jgi:glyceraldehyde 3-phosphate dehydrogenase
MKKINVAINGFGRIGRTFLRKVFLDEQINIVAINDLTAPATLAHLLKYDSIHGKFPATIEAGDNYILVNNVKIQITAEKDPSLLPWSKLNVDVVLESTGKFTKEEDAKKHIIAGAKKVIISAPATGDIKSVVMGVNEGILDGSELVISNASCTTNNAAPMIALLDKNFEIEDAYVTTVHAYTGDQNIHDGPHKDLRRSRAAAHSIIPTTTGAAKAIADVFPHLKGLIGGAGIRVPVIDGSLTDITCVVKKPATVEAINAIFKSASENELKGILEYTDEPIVSVDIIGNNHSCIFDSQLTSVLGRMVKVVGWYDNESGYSKRLVDLIHYITK